MRSRSPQERVTQGADYTYVVTALSTLQTILETHRSTYFTAHFDSVKREELVFFQQKKDGDEKYVLSKSFEAKFT